MAEKRMFTQKIIDSDAFLDMPLSTQALYFHLNMRADDDGFINNPKRIQRTIGASEDDLKLLIAKRFLICFENGVIVIKHWRMHNTLRKDRYNPTQYQDEYARLEVKDNNAYTEKNVATTWQPSGNQLATQYSIDKNSIDKLSIVEESISDSDESEPCVELPKKTTTRKKKRKTFSDDEALNDTILAYIEFRKGLKKPMTDYAIERLLKRLSEMSDSIPEQIEILNQSIDKGWQDIYPLKGGQPQMKVGGRNMPTAENSEVIKRRAEELKRKLAEGDI